MGYALSGPVLIPAISAMVQNGSMRNFVKIAPLTETFGKSDLTGLVKQLKLLFLLEHINPGSRFIRHRWLTEIKAAV